MYRTTALALAVAAALTACADATAPAPAPAVRSPGAPSFAQASSRSQINYWFDLNGTTYNPCNGEQVAFTGKAHVNGYIDTTAAGVVELKIHVNTADMHGVGLTTGDRYTLQEQLREAEQYSFDPYTDTFVFKDRYMVVSNSSTDNFESTFAFRFTYPPGTFEVTQDESRCTG